MKRNLLLAAVAVLLLAVCASSASAARVIQFTPQYDADKNGGWSSAVTIPCCVRHRSLNIYADAHTFGPQRTPYDYQYTRMENGSGGTYYVSQYPANSVIGSSLVSATVRKFTLANGCSVMARRVWIAVSYSPNRQKAIQWDSYARGLCNWWLTTYPRSS